MMRPEFPGWNEASEQQLRELVNAGYSASIAARKLGTTRNAVIGKCDRMGWTLKGEEAREGMRIKRGKQSWAGGKVVRASVAARPRPTDYVQPSPPRRFSWQEPLDLTAEPA